MSGNSCIAFAGVSVNGTTETSRLHKELMSKKNGLGYSRPLANLIYSTYITNDVASEMEKVTNPDGSPKYKKNRQGQFNAKDVAEFLGIEESIEEVNNLNEEEYRWGFTDSLAGKRTLFPDAEEALAKADDFNKKHKGLVASVIGNSTDSGLQYIVQVNERNANTVMNANTVSNKLKAWDIYKHVFSEAGISLSDIPLELQNTFTAFNDSLDSTLRNLSNMKRDHILKDSALALFFLDKDSAEVRRLVQSFGSIEDAAQALSDFNHGNNHISDAQNHLLTMAVNHAQNKLHGIDIEALSKQVAEVKEEIRDSSSDYAISQELHKLDKEFGIAIEEIKDVNEKIKTLSDLNLKARIQLKRKIDELKKTVGQNKEGKRLEAILNRMQKEYNNKHYYKGIIDFMSLAGEDIAGIDDILKSIPQTGTELERLLATCSALQKIKEIKDQYSSVISAIASDNLVIDDAVNQSDIENIKQQAKELGSYMSKKDNVIEKLTEGAMRSFLRYATNGKIKESEINDTINEAIKNVSFADRFLYSMGTQSNIVLGAVGSVIQNQYSKRSEALYLFRTLIDRATDKLYKAGFDSKFMYEDQTHIASDINWKAFEEAKEAKKEELKEKHLSGFAFRQAMERWFMENTEDRVVDKQSGRTERVPNENFRKSYDFQNGWSQAQIDYYNTVMEIKGQLETLYPESARNWYLPPQVRRNSMDAMAQGDVRKAVTNKVEDIWKVREDDTNFVQGDEVSYAKGNYDNTVKKHVPIYFQKKVEEGELLKDFSSALLHEAGSATNYDAMTEIEDLLSVVRDYVDSKAGAPNKETVENIENNKFKHTVKSLYSWGNKNNVGMAINSFMEVALYGQKRNPNEYKWLSKFMDSVIRYTSFKGLATNIPGAVANALTGVQQIFIEAGSNEFFGWKDMAWASTKLFGGTGAGGEIKEMISNNTSSKGRVLWDFFDPAQDNYQKNMDKRYHSSLFRKVVSKDLSFMGYGVGEYFIHLLPMYAILHHEKVKLNGKTVSLYDALDVTPAEDGNSELAIKEGVTDLDGFPITLDYLRKNIKGKIRYANKSMHGAMNAEDKGLIHQYCLGRLAMNFRQWMVEHYGRRFRGRHFDFSLGDWREGYWVSLYKGLMNEDTKEAWRMGLKKDATYMFMKDCLTFLFRSSTQWSNLNDMQKHNIKRARTEILTLIALTCANFALGEQDEHKKEFWRRFFIYQTKRMIVDTKAAMPWFDMPQNVFTIMQSPMAGVNTLNTLLYFYWGLTNGDLFKTTKSGEFKGWPKYIKNIVKYTIPFYKDYHRLKTLDSDDSIFKVFEQSPSGH